MKQKIIVNILICIHVGIGAFTQSLSPEIISADGNVNNASTMSIEWTLGELMVGYNNTTEILITDGFHQPLLHVMELPNLFQQASGKVNDSYEVVDVKIWPNPTDAILSIQVESFSNQNIFLECYSVTGKKVTQKMEIFPNAILELSLDNYPAGLYFLRFSSLDQKLIKSIVINKI